jgi:superfamily I DNA and/or RNA helicase
MSAMADDKKQKCEELNQLFLKRAILRVESNRITFEELAPIKAKLDTLSEILVKKGETPTENPDVKKYHEIMFKIVRDTTNTIAKEIEELTAKIKDLEIEIYGNTRSSLQHIPQNF